MQLCIGYAFLYKMEFCVLKGYYWF